ncbi:uncharacterized protein TRAVEDRAFT_92176, partial [Trametes versicolor FP-101664 SS1]|uniref:uncharacterized protein n=1 Tax=Trametes versicolor (strain FP-101664) TaxID=717944 RepID=UPI0004622F8A
CTLPLTALLWFDFVLTLPDEYRRIWRRKFTGATVIYLLIRYVAVIERIFFVLEVLVWKSISIAARATTVVVDCILIVFTWIKTFSINRDSFRMGFRTPLATLLLRDG